VVRGYTDEGEFMTLIFLAAVEEDGDTILITGKPDLGVMLRDTTGHHA